MGRGWADSPHGRIVGRRYSKNALDAIDGIPDEELLAGSGLTKQVILDVLNGSGHPTWTWTETGTTSPPRSVRLSGLIRELSWVGRLLRDSTLVHDRRTDD